MSMFTLYKYLKVLSSIEKYSERFKFFFIFYSITNSIQLI